MKFYRAVIHVKMEWNSDVSDITTIESSGICWLREKRRMRDQQ